MANFGPASLPDSTLPDITKYKTQSYKTTWNDPVSFKGVSYHADTSFESTEGSYFAHPLYFIDFIEGVIDGTSVVASPLIYNCTDSLRYIIISTL